MLADFALLWRRRLPRVVGFRTKRPTQANRAWQTPEGWTREPGSPLPERKVRPPDREAICQRCANNGCGHTESILDAEIPKQVIWPDQEACDGDTATGAAIHNESADMGATAQEVASAFAMIAKADEACGGTAAAPRLNATGFPGLGLDGWFSFR